VGRATSGLEATDAAWPQKGEYWPREGPSDWGGLGQPVPGHLRPFQHPAGLLMNVVEEWREQPRREGEHTRIMDGNVWNTIKDHKGKPFFSKASLEEPSELRVGVTVSVDW
jgi:hypothetical protein